MQRNKSDEMDLLEMAQELLNDAEVMIKALIQENENLKKLLKLALVELEKHEE